MVGFSKVSEDPFGTFPVSEGLYQQPSNWPGWLQGSTLIGVEKVEKVGKTDENGKFPWASHID